MILTEGSVIKDQESEIFVRNSGVLTAGLVFKQQSSVSIP